VRCTASFDFVATALLPRLTAEWPVFLSDILLGDRLKRRRLCGQITTRLIT
jgi:hypothetical protein